MLGSASASRRPTSNSSRSTAALVGHRLRTTAYAGTLRIMDREPELLSVVAPMYEEQDTVDPFTERVAAALEGIDYELILVDDGSKDRTRRRRWRAPPRPTRA